MLLKSTNFVNFDTQNNDGDTGFLCLCKATQDIKSIEILVHKCDVNKKNKGGDCALLVAARQDDYALIKLLIEQGEANVNISNKEKETSLCIACEKENIKVVKYLIEHGADPNLQNSIGFTGLLHACQRNHTKIAKFLLKNQVTHNYSLTNLRTYSLVHSFTRQILTFRMRRDTQHWFGHQSNKI